MSSVSRLFYHRNTAGVGGVLDDDITAKVIELDLLFMTGEELIVYLF